MIHTHPSSLPTIPGVYLFKAVDGTIVYIGKAKNLRVRVRSYFTACKTDWKVKALIDEHDHIAHIPTATEHQALILEAQLIQQYQPKYNRLLKEGQPFVYIVYTTNAKLRQAFLFFLRLQNASGGWGDKPGTPFDCEHSALVIQALVSAVDSIILEHT